MDARSLPTIAENTSEVLAEIKRKAQAEAYAEQRELAQTKEAVENARNNSDRSAETNGSDRNNGGGNPATSADNNGDIGRTGDSKAKSERKTIEVVATAYTAGPESTGKSPGDEGYGITASGTKVAEGRTVACPSHIPFGTRVSIEGLGERVCEDRGAAITKGRIDVYMSDLRRALDFGRQSVEVRILN